MKRIVLEKANGRWSVVEMSSNEQFPVLARDLAELPRVLLVKHRAYMNEFRKSQKTVEPEKPVPSKPSKGTVV